MLLRMEIARMFGVLPLDLLAVPQSEYRRLTHYYFEVKRAEKEATSPHQDMDLPDGVEMVE